MEKKMETPVGINRAWVKFHLSSLHNEHYNNIAAAATAAATATAAAAVAASTFPPTALLLLKILALGHHHENYYYCCVALRGQLTLCAKLLAEPLPANLSKRRRYPGNKCS